MQYNPETPPPPLMVGRRLFAGQLSSVLAISLLFCPLASCNSDASFVPESEPLQRLSVVVTLADDGVMLSWATRSDMTDVLINWRAGNDAPWNQRVVRGADHVFVDQLVIGVAQQFIVAARTGATVTAADTFVATPRLRPDCAYTGYSEHQVFFCSRVAAEAWMISEGLVATDLMCRNKPVIDWGPESPDCSYTGPNGFRMLLLRNVDAVFNPPVVPPSINDTRNALRRAIWPLGHPFNGPSPVAITTLPSPLVGKVTQYRTAESYLFDDGGPTKSRVTRFRAVNPIAGLYAIYHEGHGEPGVDIGGDVIDSLLVRGWDVYAMDMPLAGLNRVDIVGDDSTHYALDKYDDGVTSMLSRFMMPVKYVVDLIATQRTSGTFLLMIGRSGGGFTAFNYAALDPRITALVSVAGGRPISQRLDSPVQLSDLGDYEQTLPEIFSVIRQEDLMVSGGTRGALMMFNTLDPCCFRVSSGDPFLQYLADGGARTGRTVRAFVDVGSMIHGIGPNGFVELDRFLRDVVH